MKRIAILAALVLIVHRPAARSVAEGLESPAPTAAPAPRTRMPPGPSSS
jgi:hypothetical protein